MDKKRFVALRKALLVSAAGALSLSACGGSTTATSTPSNSGNSPSQMASPSSSSSPSVSVSPTQSASASPTATHPTPDCGRFKDNSSVPIPTFKETDVVYYLFACAPDSRVIVRVKGGKGQVVHADLYTSYTFGQISFATGSPVETQTFLHGGGFGSVPGYWGTPFDLHMDQLVRIAGPSTDIKVYYAQDCADFKEVGSHKTCTKMGIGSSPRFIKEGDVNKWVNEYAS